jgi:hypothetical protein
VAERYYSGDKYGQVRVREGFAIVDGANTKRLDPRFDLHRYPAENSLGAAMAPVNCNSPSRYSPMPSATMSALCGFIWISTDVSFRFFRIAGQ